MPTLKILFFFGVFIIIYSYLGYGILLWLLISLRNLFKKGPALPAPAGLPGVTLVVAAYNEEGFIADKIKNTLSLEYPKDKFHFIVITDGSSDNTAEVARSFPGVRVLHESARRGKIAAIHRAMGFVKSEIVIFSDANTLLNKDSIYNIARHYQSAKVGGVAGEKKVLSTKDSTIAGSGEGLYWKYESFLKKLDSEFYTVVGAAGELFSIRTSLYEYVGDNVLLDDFIISLKICKKGYKVVYEPGAFAMEAPSVSVTEEQKRKVRISAGAFQSIIMLSDLLNIFKYPVLSFQYISHRVLRWTLCPLFLPLILLLNSIIVIKGASLFYTLLLICQLVFYLAAAAGYILYLKNIKMKLLFAPYYFVFLNFSLYLGFIKYIRGRQSVLWDKAARENMA